jgi:hypothetical protein
MNNNEQVHASLEKKVFSKPSLHFLLGKLEFIIKNTRKCKQGRRKTKCNNHQIFEAKIIASFLTAIDSQKTLIINGDQNL